MNDDTCPLNPGGHRFFIFKTFETYEPVNPDAVMDADNIPDRQFYEKVEYAIAGCNCAAVRKIRVQE